MILKVHWQGALRRGFVNTKMVMLDGKETLSVYITQAGKFFLDQEDKKKWGSAYNIN